MVEIISYRFISFHIVSYYISIASVRLWLCGCRIQYSKSISVQNVLVFKSWFSVLLCIYLFTRTTVLRVLCVLFAKRLNKFLNL
ncbi:MAG: hypothetical protein ACI8RD_009499 [Bacillariaceae sp.]|jgi:hypothetical protein